MCLSLSVDSIWINRFMVADCVKETYPARFQSAENLLNNISDLQDEDWKWVGSATTRFNYRLVAADDSRIVSLDDPRLGIVHGGNHDGSAVPDDAASLPNAKEELCPV